MIVASTRFLPSPDALAARVGEEIVLVHTRTDQIYVLNRTGARVWELLSDDVDRADIERRLSDEFDIAAVDAGPQIDDLLASLIDRQLISERGQ